MIHIEYKNLNFNFTKVEYSKFAKYFKDLDGKYWEQVNKKSHYRRKILVPIGHKNLNILLNNAELSELQELLVNDFHCNRILNKELFNYKGIDFEYLLN